MRGCVWDERNHMRSSDISVFRMFIVSDELHVSTWRRCSSGALQRGQLADSRFFRCNITLPVAVSPLSHLVTNSLRLKDASFLAVAYAYQCK